MKVNIVSNETINKVTLELLSNYKIGKQNDKLCLCVY